MMRSHIGRVSLLLVCAVAVSSCGGGGSSSDSSGTTIITPAPGPVATPKTTLTIQTYERAPDIAYPAVITAAVSSLTTETVSVDTPASSGDYSQIEIAKTGYQPTWYPYSPQDSSSIQIGMYKAKPINPQPGFAKAIIPVDAGGWLMDYYRGGHFPTTMDRIRKIGGNMVVYADSAIIKSLDMNSRSVSLYGKYFPPDSVLLDMGSMAKSRGLELTFMMGIYPGDALGNDSWTVPKFYDAIAPLSNNDPFWDGWFGAYKAILAERAALAQKAGATRLVIGFNLDFMVDKGNRRWADLIGAVRAAGFTGKIAYFAGTNGSYNGLLNIADPVQRQEFIKLFDEVGLDFNNPVIPNGSETLSPDQPMSRIVASIKSQVSSIASAGVPIFIMIATPSVHAGSTSSEYMESAYTCDMIKGQTRDYQTQADVYEAAAEVINSQAPAGSGGIKGLFSWGYHYIDNPRRHLANGDACYDYSASIRNKPAEAVLSYWFKGW